MPPYFKDREDAGRQLAEAMPRHYRGRDDVIVLGLPRGGVPVAEQVAKALNAPLDVLVVRKLGVPGQKEFAMGAIAPGGVTILDEYVVREMGVSREAVDAVREAEQKELDRRLRRYRAGRPALALAGKTAILVDDGLATGSTMQAAVAAARKSDAAAVVVAVPVSSSEACALLAAQADAVVCPFTPPRFLAVGKWYASFPQTSDEEVCDILLRRS
ncbi:phosphoribosyltransferase [Parapusillimonas granuli]|uniref:Phosphoribosyltransferase n=1 Tax=Parapusillimonas granuli TaxID=380911 RepID=A0A853G294_9BURK|nr:phosphoribosyltransferase family protein [Parapusillimonas granuli]MBB5214471.1 putative phosphoribosyltransferase [Parapusillimonas granuli]MEB2398283.1 phosphoribosyltransferase family protein [Alcaligenaceae bacterium]NYT49120.1 phosphoribosyltransferase [Parapusillimonas granuli]